MGELVEGVEVGFELDLGFVIGFESYFSTWMVDWEASGVVGSMEAVLEQNYSFS